MGIILGESTETVGAYSRRAHHREIHGHRAALVTKDATAQSAVMAALGDGETGLAFNTGGVSAVGLPVRLGIKTEGVPLDDVFEKIKDEPSALDVRSRDLVGVWKQLAGNSTKPVVTENEIGAPR